MYITHFAFFVNYQMIFFKQSFVFYLLSYNNPMTNGNKTMLQIKKVHLLKTMYRTVLDFDLAVS